MEARIVLRARHEFGDAIDYMRKVKGESDFSQEVLVGINAIQRAQKNLAPRGKQGRIPASIKAARITKTQNMWSAVSRTSYGPAVFTNEGTGTHGPKGAPYEIVQNRVYKSGPLAGQSYIVNIMHPGIRGTHWWEAGAVIGSKIGLEAFRRKVGRILRSR